MSGVNVDAGTAEQQRGPESEAALDDLLTRPTAATIAAARDLGGDVLVLGAGGKMGPSLAVLALRSLQAAGLDHRVIAVSRFGDAAARRRLEQAGVQTIACDLLDPDATRALPDAPNVVFAAGLKFGTSGAPHKAWVMNTLMPALVAERFRASRIVALSTGNVYPFTPPSLGGADEDTPPAPIGEYAQSCLGRERMLEHIADRHGTPVTIVRLFYATDLRYGVLLDLAQRIARGDSIPLGVSTVQTIWQGDANAALLRAFGACAAPPFVVNLVSPELLDVRTAADDLAALLDRPAPTFTGAPATTSLLGDPRRCVATFGRPTVSAATLLRWTAQWVAAELPVLNRPTKFQVTDGRF